MVSSSVVIIINSSSSTVVVCIYVSIPDALGHFSRGVELAEAFEEGEVNGDSNSCVCSRVLMTSCKCYYIRSPKFYSVFNEYVCMY